METKSGKNPLRDYTKSIRRNGGFIAYTDSSWGPGVAHPMFGFGLYLFGGVVSFTAKQLKIVASSSCEAEYAAAANCCREITFIRNLCRDMGFMLVGALVLVVDNTAAIDVAENMGVTAKTKHFQTCVHYFRFEVQHNRIAPVHCLSKYQRADGYTKALDKTNHITWSDGAFDLSKVL